MGQALENIQLNVQFKIIRMNGWSIFNKKKLAIVHTAFFLLFPGFFFYQTLLGIGAIDPFLGGYFSIVSMALVLPLAFCYLLDANRLRNYFSATDFYFFLFVLYFALIVGVNYMAGSDVKLIVDHLTSIVHMINLFIVFKALDFRSKSFQIMAMLSLLVMSGIVFFYSNDGFFDLKDESLKNTELIATYQGFARSYLITFIAAIVFYRSLAIRVLSYVLAGSALFINGARSEFVAMLGLIPLVELYYSRSKVMAIIAIGAVVLLVDLSFNDIISSLPDSRIFELTDLSKSTSASARQYLSSLAMNTISRNPFLGDYGSYAAGGYAHNVLSAWVDLGLPGFLFLLAMLLYPAVDLVFNGYFRKRKSSDFLMPASLVFVTILLLMTSHYFTDMLIGAALGAYARYQFGKRMHHDKVRGAFAAPVNFAHTERAA